MQQAHAQVLFQPLEALAGDGHGKIEAARRGADGTLIQHAHEQDEVADAIHFQ
jgi:hypothetical protein